MDLYQITGRALYIDAVDGFVEMFAAHFMHVGGTVAIKEWKLYVISFGHRHVRMCARGKWMLNRFEFTAA
jgi:hypothetical protein